MNVKIRCIKNKQININGKASLYFQRNDPNNIKRIKIKFWKKYSQKKIIKKKL